MERLLARLIGATDVEAAEGDLAAASRSVRQALGELLRSQRKSDRKAGQAVKRFLLGDRRWTPDLAHGMRHLRGGKVTRRALEKLKGIRRFDARRDGWTPRGDWLTIKQAATLSEYNWEHVGWILRNHPEIRRVTYQGHIWLRKKDFMSYWRKQQRRGYGPR